LFSDQTALDLNPVKVPGHRMFGRKFVTESALASGSSLDSVIEAFDLAASKIIFRCVTRTTNTIGKTA
jgi:hypothetical protein